MDDSFLFWVRKYEDFDRHPRMSGSGYVRIGFGRNIDEKGISLPEASLMLKNDLEIIYLKLQDHEWFDEQPIFVKDSIVHLCYIITVKSFLVMEDLIACFKQFDYHGAAKDILDLRRIIPDSISTGHILSTMHKRLNDIASHVSEGATHYESAS